MISTHLSTFQPQKWDFAKHAQPQPKKERAYKKKKVYSILFTISMLDQNQWYDIYTYYVLSADCKTNRFQSWIVFCELCFVFCVLYDIGYDAL